jgi:ATP-dependent helicase HrpA
VPADAWRLDQVPAHLKVTVAVHDHDGRELARGKDVRSLQTQLQPVIRESLSTVLSEIERDGLTEWDFGTLERERRTTAGGQPVIGYPALVDCGDSVAIKVLQSRTEQNASMWGGVRRLLLLSVPSPVKAIVRAMGNEAKLAIGASAYPTPVALLDDCVAGAADSIITGAGELPFDETAFRALRERAGAELPGRAAAMADYAQQVLRAAQRVRARLADRRGPAADDMRAQLADLTGRGFVSATGWEQLPELPRYVSAIEWRLDRLADNPGRDAERMAAVHAVEEEYHELLRDRPRLPAARRNAIRWSLQELRVSYFAQPLGTAGPVSEKRIVRAIDAARAAALE